MRFQRMLWLNKRTKAYGFGRWRSDNEQLKITIEENNNNFPNLLHWIEDYIRPVKVRIVKRKKKGLA